MRKATAIAGFALALSVAAIAAAFTIGPGIGSASSHREAPLIAEDPSADLTDLYAFRSPDKSNTVTLLANVIPGEDPAAGPNWYTFSPGARYNIKVDTNGDASPDVIYRFQFQRKTGQFFLGDTAQPFTTTGRDRPRNSGIRRAGVVRTMPRVWVYRSPATVFAIANRHGIAEYWTALPITKNESDSRPALRPM